MIENNSVKKKRGFANVVLTPKLIYTLLFSLLWVQNTAYLFLQRIFVRIPVVELFYDLILPSAVIILTVAAIPYLYKKVGSTEIFIYTGFCIAIGLSLIFSVQAVQDAIMTDLFRIVATVLPMIFIGSAFDITENERLLFWLSLAGVVAYVLFQIYAIISGVEAIEDNMGPAYLILPSVAYLIYYAYSFPKLVNWICAIGGIILLLSYGTRGTILCVLVFAAGLLIYKLFSMRSFIAKSFLIIAILVFLAFCVFGDLIYIVADGLGELFSELGLSTRLFDMFLEENIADDSGRSGFAGAVLEGVSMSPIIGHGIMGDRAFVSTYAHNIVYELWCSFGVILGTLLFAAAVILPVCAMIKARTKSERLFIWMLFSTVFVKLFLSSSYLYEVNLFLLIGYALAILKKYKGIEKNALSSGVENEGL